jgi:hypothetical protein
MRLLLLLSLSTLACPSFANGPAPADPDLAKARAFFQRYVALEQAFDPSLADLYADDALIRASQLLPNGRTKTMPIPASHYKKLIRQAMQIARERDDKRIYTEVRYAKEPRGVRVRAKRFFVLEETQYPFAALLGPWRDGEWRILEEFTLSQPK